MITPLHRAVFNNNTYLVRQLLDIDGIEGVDVNVKLDNGWTPLHIASYKGYLEIVNALITTGADVNLKDNDGWTPLHLASANGHLETLNALIAVEDIDVNAKDNDGHTPLHRASHYDIAEIAKVLINTGADLYIEDNDGHTALDIALQCVKTEIVKVLQQALEEQDLLKEPDVY